MTGDPEIRVQGSGKVRSPARDKQGHKEQQQKP
jgi:hypothetical protein